MTAIQIAAFVLAAVMGSLVVLTRDPLRQAIVVGMYGLSLTVLFVVLQAPDVALSVVAVGVVALPLMILLALAKVRERGS
jgi:energy-converting hydrogenase B subunit D